MKKEVIARFGLLQVKKMFQVIPVKEAEELLELCQAHPVFRRIAEKPPEDLYREAMEYKAIDTAKSWRKFVYLDPSLAEARKDDPLVE